MKVQDLLKRKGSKVVNCRQDNSIGEAAQLIIQHSVGAILVIEPKGALVGILSERDVARAVAEKRDSFSAVKVADYMTREVTVIAPDVSVKDAMRKMGQRTIRHLPVVGDGNLLGVISQRDVLKAILDDTQLEVNVLRDVALTKV